jgi:WhiB family redox-sensing transcriptional regulator
MQNTITELDLEDALCAQTNPDVFFPENGNRWQLQDARKTCARCPIIEKCLDMALAFSDYEDHGIWGGASEYMRRGMRRNPQLKAVHLEEMSREKRRQEDAKNKG